MAPGCKAKTAFPPRSFAGQVCDEPRAIVVGAHANGLGVIRALVARDVPTVAITTRPFDVAHYSRWVSEHHRLSRLHEDAGALVDLLERHASRRSGWAVFPTNDDALTALARNHERLSRFYRLAVQPWEVVSHLVDKDRMHGLAAAAGLDVPVCHGPATADLASRPDVRFPLVPHIANQMAERHVDRIRGDPWQRHLNTVQLGADAWPPVSR